VGTAVAAASDHQILGYLRHLHTSVGCAWSVPGWVDTDL